MFCPNCGKELAEGEICTCAATTPEATPAPEQNTYYNPPVGNPQADYYTPAQQPQPPVNGYEGYQAPQYYVLEQKAPARTDYPEGYKIKKKYVAVILGFTLGILGIHNFYLGNTTKAIAQILLSTVGALLVVGPFISAVWAIVETVLLLTEETDADANNFKIQTFEEILAEKLNK